MKDKVIKFIDGLSTMTVSEWTQLIVFLIAVINGALIIFGLNPLNVSESFVYTGLSGALVILIPLYNKYKNWNISKEAKSGQQVTDLLKLGIITTSQLNIYIANMKQQAQKENWENKTFTENGGK